MIPITTSNSTSVNPVDRRGGLDVRKPQLPLKAEMLFHLCVGWMSKKLWVGYPFNKICLRNAGGFKSVREKALDGA
jgi:hypothetical protein